MVSNISKEWTIPLEIAHCLKSPQLMQVKTLGLCLLYVGEAVSDRLSVKYSTALLSTVYNRCAYTVKIGDGKYYTVTAQPIEKKNKIINHFNTNYEDSTHFCSINIHHPDINRTCKDESRYLKLVTLHMSVLLHITGLF